MGAVYLAERADDEYQQQVALKVVKRGMDPDSSCAASAPSGRSWPRLDHPSIARLLDGGATADGLPYFVMEYVEGEPIDEYCEAHAAVARGAARAVPRGLRRRAVRAPEPRRAPRPQARQHPGDAPRARSSCSTSASPSCSSQDERPRATDGHRRRAGAMTPGVREPRAGAGRAHHDRERRLLAGRAALRAADRPSCRYRVRRPASRTEVARVIASGAAEPRPSTRRGRGPERRSPPPPARGRPRQHRAHGAAQGARAPLRVGGPARRGRPAAPRGPAGHRAARTPWRYRAGKFVRRHRGGRRGRGRARSVARRRAWASPSWQARVARRERARAEQRFEDVRQLANSSSSSSTTPSRTCPARRRRGSSWSAAAWSTSTASSREGGNPALQRDSRTPTGGWATCRASQLREPRRQQGGPGQLREVGGGAARARCGAAGRPAHPPRSGHRDLPQGHAARRTLQRFRGGRGRGQRGPGHHRGRGRRRPGRRGLAARPPQHQHQARRRLPGHEPAGGVARDLREGPPAVRGGLPQDGRQRGSVQLRHRPGQGRYGSPAARAGGRKRWPGWSGRGRHSPRSSRRGTTSPPSAACPSSSTTSGTCTRKRGTTRPPSPPIARPWPCARCSLRPTRAMRWRART